MAAATAGCAEALALAVREIGERRIVAGRDQRRVMKLVFANHASRWSDRAVGQNPRLRLAELQLALREARCMAGGPGYGMASPFGVSNSLAQHPVSAAFP